MAKVTEAQVSTIRELWKSGMTEKMIGAAYGLRQTTVNLIRRGVTWKHVSGSTVDASISHGEPATAIFAPNHKESGEQP